ncbi:MAG TPA: DUF3037 domain-containing protein [Anaerolineae bacterium]|nr:DUF3037 domain-containing protein [Anaerolineae bacterium]
MNESAPFEYAVIRIVPHEARGEFMNAGVILYCPAHRFLQARISFDIERLKAFSPTVDIAHVQEHLATIPKICAGNAEAGELGKLSLAERFRWLTSPRNTIIQTSPVHSGLTDDPAKTLEHLVARLVVLPTNQ